MEPSQIKDFVRTFVKDKFPPQGSKVSIFIKNEGNDGPLSESLTACLQDSYNLQEMKDFMNSLSKVKIPCELAHLTTAASFVEWSFKKIIKEVEN